MVGTANTPPSESLPAVDPSRERGRLRPPENISEQCIKSFKGTCENAVVYDAGKICTKLPPSSDNYSTIKSVRPTSDYQETKLIYGI